MADGRLVASWRRLAGFVQVAPWQRLDAATRDRVSAEAEGLGPLLGRPIKLEWLAS
jgi:hypothetical protein